jgi:S1-C subfamily serine protease
MRAVLTLAFLLATAPAYAVDVSQMVAANFLLENKCSATLIGPRTVLTNYHCIETEIAIVEREEVKPDGTVTKVKRVHYTPVMLFQHSYGGGGIAGRTELRAEIQAADRRRDLAVLRIASETAVLPAPARLPADAYVLVQGQEVYAIGNPVGLENTVTRGILSHLYREHKWDSDQIARYIQTDATIAGGSSGGALYSADGLLLGVPSAGYRGAALSFAIPFPVVKEFLRANGYAFLWDLTAPTREAWLVAEKAKAEAKRSNGTP